MGFMKNMSTLCFPQQTEHTLLYTHIHAEHKHDDRNTDPVFLSMSGVSNKMSDLGAEVFPDCPTHVMNHIHQAFLQGNHKH